MNKLTFFYVFLFSVLLVSCKKVELNYSCDPTEDQWVKNHLIEVRIISLNEMSQFPIQRQRAIWNALSPEKRYSFWQQKIISEIENPVWNSQQHLQIVKLQSIISQESFIDIDTASRNTMIKSANIWLIECINGKIFTKVEISILAGTFYSQDEGKKQILSKKQSVVKSATVECDCASTATIFCTTGEGDCRSNNCTIHLYGCGWFWMQDCDSLCGT